MDEKELEALYNAMSNRFDVGSFDEFKSKMQTPEDRKRFYDVVNSKGLDLGDYNQYEQRLSGQKKSLFVSSGGKLSSADGHVSLADLMDHPELGVKTTEETPKIDAEDPIKSIMEPIRKSAYSEAKTYKTLSQRPVSESTGQINLRPENVELKNRQIADQSNVLSNLSNTQEFVEKHAFPTGKSAKNYIANIVAKKGKAPENNETFIAATKKAAQTDQLHNTLTHIGVDEAAIDEYMTQNPNFSQQMAKINIAAHTTPSSGQLIPEGLKGQIIASYIQNHKDDLEEISKEEAAKGDPDGIAEDYNDWKNNLRSKLPEFGANQIANEVSRKRQELGLNSRIANFNTEQFNKNTDKVAEDLYKNDPQSMSIYNNIIKPNKKKYIDVPGFLNRFEQGIEQGASGTRNTINIFEDSPAYNIYRGLEEQSQGVSAGEIGSYKTFGQLGSMAGFVSYMAALGNIGVPEKAAIGTTFLGNSIKEGDEKFPNNRGKAIASAITNTAAFMAMSNLLPIKKVNEAIGGVKTEINKAIDGISDENVSAAAIKDAASTGFKKALEYSGAFAKQYGKALTEITAITMFNQGMDKVLGLRGDAYRQYHPEDETSDVIKSMAVGNIIPSVAAGYANYAKRDFSKNSVWEAANNPKRMSNVLDNSGLPQPTIDALKEKINHLSKVKDDLHVAGLSEEDQKTYLLHASNEFSLTKNAEESTSPTLKKKYTDEAKRSSEIQAAIIKGIPEEKIKENHAIKDVKELYDNELLNKGASEMLESKKTSESEPKFDEEKVKPFLKYLAQQANNITGKGEFDTGSDARKSVEKQFPSQLIDIANEMFPEYRQLADEHDAGQKVSEPIETIETEVNIPKPPASSEEIFKALDDAARTKKSVREKNRAMQDVSDQYGDRGKRAYLINANLDDIVKTLKQKIKIEVKC